MAQRTGLGGASKPALPYNLLMTRSWMLLVPRSRESCNGVFVNALGFAGSLFVRDEVQLAAIYDTGPMTVLENTGFPG